MEQRNCWSADGQVFYESNNAWGTHAKLGLPVWLGKREDVLKKHPVGPKEPPVPRRLSTKEVTRGIKAREKALRKEEHESRRVNKDITSTPRVGRSSSRKQKVMRRS